ncbi:MAG: hypothetical protein NTX25_00300 [Proteobacteria bacterium]|nr:hypothetical protein [Pseudomonadota bacterium]
MARLWRQEIQEYCLKTKDNPKAVAIIQSRGLDPDLIAEVSPAFDMGQLSPHRGSISSRLGDHWEAACLKKGNSWFPGLIAGTGLTLPLWSQFEFPTSFDLRLFSPESSERKSIRSWGNGLHHVYARSFTDLSNPHIWLVEGYWDYLTALEIAAKIGWTGAIIGLPGSGLTLPRKILEAKTLLVMVHENKSIERTKKQLVGVSSAVRYELLRERHDLNDGYSENAVLATQGIEGFLRAFQ